MELGPDRIGIHVVDMLHCRVASILIMCRMLHIGAAHSLRYTGPLIVDYNKSDLHEFGNVVEHNFSANSTHKWSNLSSYGNKSEPHLESGVAAPNTSQWLQPQNLSVSTGITQESTSRQGLVPRRQKSTSERLSEYEQFKQQKAIEAEVAGLQHAEEAIGYMEEHAANKLKSDIDDIDHMIVRQHLLTDRKNETDINVKFIASNIGTMAKITTELDAHGKTAESKAVRADEDELGQAIATLRGSANELYDLQGQIKHVTDDGRKMDLRVMQLSMQRAAIHRQIQRLDAKEERIKDVAEEQDDLKAFEKAGFDNIRSEDDPYMKEAAESLEKISGWDRSKLDEEAIKAREAMNAGLKSDPGAVAKALNSLR